MVLAAATENDGTLRDYLVVATIANLLLSVVLLGKNPCAESRAERIDPRQDLTDDKMKTSTMK